MTLSILSYNIWNYSGSWRRRRTLLLDTMRKLRPDVIALQEVRHGWTDPPGANQARWLAHRLGLQFAFCPAHIHWIFPPVVEGLAVLTRQPLEGLQHYGVEKVAGSGPSRVILHARVSGVDLYDVHFPLTERARNLEAVQLANLVNDTSRGRTLVMGDFNADLEQPPMRILRERGFVDLWTRLERSSEWPQGRRIDYALGRGATSWRGQIEVVGSQPDAKGRLPSDHPGLFVRLIDL